MLVLKKILFISLSNIGDCLLSLPTLDLVLASWPQAEITVLCGPRPAEIFMANPRFKVIIYDKHSGLKEKIRLFQRLKKEKFEMVLDLRDTAFSRLLPIKYKIFSRRCKSMHMVEKHISGLRHFLKKDIQPLLLARKALSVGQRESEKIEALLKENGIFVSDALVVVSPGARSDTKRWPQDSFAHLCQKLRQECGVKVVLVGDQNDAAIAAGIARENQDKLLDLSAKTNLLELAALLKRAKLLITNDSAVMHLASYLDLPTLAIFGPTDEKKYGPWSKIKAVVKKDIWCRPCAKAQCRFWSLQCLKLIKVEEVFDTAKKLLSSLEHFSVTLEKAQFQRILICRTDRIGDVLLSTPVIKALRQAFPCAYIAMLVSAQAREIVEGNPYLDKVFIFDKHNSEKGFWGMRRFAQRLKKERFDLALILHPTNRMHLLTFWAGIRRRIGYDRKLDFLLTDKIAHTKEYGEKHETEYALDFVRYLGIEPTDKSLYMPIKKEAEIWADNLLRQEGIDPEVNNLVVLHPTASCPSKIWPAERFAQVADQLILKYRAKIAVISAQADSPIVKELIKNIHSAVIDLSGKTSLAQLASLLKRAKLFISNDSGPVHISSAVGLSLAETKGV